MATRNNLIFTSNFDDATNPYQGFDLKQNQDPGLSYSKQILSGGREGGMCLRQEQRYNDPRMSSGSRSEIVPIIPGGDSGDMWYGWSTMYEVLDGGYGGHYNQWHPGNNTGSANEAIWPYEKTHMVVRCLNGANTYQNGAKAIAFNVWNDYVWHIKWATDKTGIVELWLNGAKIFSYTGQNTEKDSYLKVGINRFGNTSTGAPVSGTWAIRTSNIRIGRNTAATPVGYADVAPGDTVVANKPPIANAGGDIVIKAPADSVVLNGVGSDSDGVISAYAWSLVSGNASAVIETPASATSKMSALKPGNYTARLTVTDNAGASASDDVNVLVQPADVTPPPPAPKLTVKDSQGNVKFAGDITEDITIIV